MNIAAIETFLCVVRTRNLNSAADELHVTQSAVTARLDALEQALGQKLLVRSRKGAKMTKAGFAFLEQAQVIARTWENARAKASLPAGLTNLFSFACAVDLWTGLGEDWISRQREKHREIAFEVWSADVASARSWLLSGMCDAALLAEPISTPEVASREFVVETLIEVSTDKRDAVAWDQKYIYVDYGPDIRRQHAEAWPGDETARMSFSQPDWALKHLLSTGGAAYLPERFVAPLIAESRLYPVNGAVTFTRPTYLSWRRSSEADFAWLSDPA
jgi:DNA-binding transcriptional LysR family regulator